MLLEKCSEVPGVFLLINVMHIIPDLWSETLTQKKKKKTTDPFNPDRRGKPVTVSDILFTHHSFCFFVSLIFDKRFTQLTNDISVNIMFEFPAAF